MRKFIVTVFVFLAMACSLNLANAAEVINIDDKFTYTPINGFTTADLGSEKGNALLSYVNRLDADNV